MAALSSPRAEGELNNEPTTEKRKRAHKAAVEHWEFLVITSPHESGENDCETNVDPINQHDRRHLLRVDLSHQEILIFRPPVIVIGERKRSRRSQPSR